MDTVTMSSNYEVAIPRAVREQLGLVPGQVMQVIAYGERIELLPVRDASELRGVLRGFEVTFERDEGDRL